MKLARFEVTGSLLRDLLALPKNSQIVDIRNGRCVGMDMDVEVVVKCDDFKDVPDGENPPVRTPWFQSVDGRPQFLEWR